MNYSSKKCLLDQAITDALAAVTLQDIRDNSLIKKILE
jgi:hypothetical protein